jgi:hypothetical protein
MLKRTGQAYESCAFSETGGVESHLPAIAPEPMRSRDRVVRNATMDSLWLPPAFRVFHATLLAGQTYTRHRPKINQLEDRER